MAPLFAGTQPGIARKQKLPMNDKKKKTSDSPTTLMEGVGRMFAVIMLLLRGLAILVICWFLYRYIEPLLQ